MDHSHAHCELNETSGESDVDYSIQGTEGENLSVTSSSGNDSLFQDVASCAPTRTRRKQTIIPASSSSSDSSVSDLSSRNSKCTQEIAEHLENLCKTCRKQKKRKTEKEKHQVKQKKPQSVTVRKSRYSIPLKERRRRMIDKGIPFPCAPSKRLPLNQYFAYEQHVLSGFLNRIKDLKYENSLKSSLKDMRTDEDGESEDFEMRKYSYMDEDGSLSPISEPGENLEDKEDEEVKVVENSEFILDSQVPSKKNWQIK